MVDVGGVGYDVLVPLSTFYAVGEPGARIVLRIHTHVREDALQLYGFATVLEEQLFEKLIGVSGIGPKLAEKIVAHRNEQGSFPSRASLRQVAGLGPKAFEQSAGFLRVRDGDEPLDGSAIHPESYVVARQVLKRARLSLAAR